MSEGRSFNDWSDEELLGRLTEALQEARDVPPDFVRMGKSVFGLRELDHDLQQLHAELAELTYDSFRDEALSPALTRAEHADLRFLAFAARDDSLKIELEIHDGVAIGQIYPEQPGEAKITPVTGAATTVIIDDVGGFAIRPLPVGQFRLDLATRSGHRVYTDLLMFVPPPHHP